MRLDHISYAASHDQFADVVQRLGSRIGAAFTDGGIHPRFGTRNFTLPLKNGHYLEVVCPLDHPAADASPFGKIVTRRVNEGGGWLTWVVSTDDISQIEDRLGRKSVNGHRTRPDGTDLRWKQIGVLDNLDNSQLPFFIQWLTTEHPSNDGKAVAEISMIEISGSEPQTKSWLDLNVNSVLDGITVKWVSPELNNNEIGITAVHLKTPLGNIILD